MDETIFGGNSPGKCGWRVIVKIIVFGIYQRNGKVLTFHISSRAKETMQPYITQYTKAGSLNIMMNGLPIPSLLSEEITW